MTQHEPLTPAVLHILLALSKGAMHGYAIMQHVEALSAGQVTMGPGTLYGSIKRMLSADLIAEVDAPHDDADSRRKYYALTDTGRITLRTELSRLADLIRYAQANDLIEEGDS